MASCLTESESTSPCYKQKVLCSIPIAAVTNQCKCNGMQSHKLLSDSSEVKSPKSHMVAFSSTEGSRAVFLSGESISLPLQLLESTCFPWLTAPVLHLQSHQHRPLTFSHCHPSDSLSCFPPHLRTLMI